MPRGFSESTIKVLKLLWERSCASAGNIELVSDAGITAISNVLSRGVDNGLLKCATLGRVRAAVQRYVFSEAGVRRMHEERGWPVSWWHTAPGITALARRLEVVEMAYHYLPQLWQSNLSGSAMCRVYRDPLDVDRNGGPVWRPEPVERDWRYGRLVEFHWVGNELPEAVAAYDDGSDEDTRLYVPVLWRGNFQSAADFATLRRDLDDAFIEDERWWRLTNAQAFPPDNRAPVVIFCPDRGSAAFARRNWREEVTGNNATTAVIMDAEGQVTQSMDFPPTALWWGFRPQEPPVAVRDVTVDNLGDIKGGVEALESGPYAAVNGTQAWKLLWGIHGSPGIEPDQSLSFLTRETEKIRVVRKEVEVRKTKANRRTKKAKRTRKEQVASPLLQGMVDVDVMTKLSGSLYLLEAGMALVADSLLRQTHAKRRLRRVARRHAIYLNKSGVYRRKQRIHSVKTTEAILQLRRHGFYAFPAMGMVIEYLWDGRRVRVDPDAFVILPSGVMIAIEFERSAKTETPLRRKAEKYLQLERIGHPISVLFITETEEAAKILADLRYPYLLAASLDAVREGPHGRAVAYGNRWVGPRGCWWFWRPNAEESKPDAQINLGAQMYLQDHPNGEWQVPDTRWFRRRRA